MGVLVYLGFKVTHPHVDGQGLADEFAMSQALMNVGTEIRIRSADRGRAEEALAAAKQAGAELSEAGEDPEDPEGSGAS